ncbi:hypothetical protein ES705_49057 [subsurface metagenome]
MFGDFILDFEFKTINDVHSDSSGFYFLGPVKSTQSYYAFAFSDDSLSFFFIDDGKISHIDKKAISINKSEWNKVRVVRIILSRQLRFTINNDLSEHVVFSDRNLVMGYIGFGTHQTISYLRNISVWAPTAIVDSTFSW